MSYGPPAKKVKIEGEEDKQTEQDRSTNGNKYSPSRALQNYYRSGRTQRRKARLIIGSRSVLVFVWTKIPLKDISF